MRVWLPPTLIPLLLLLLSVAGCGERPQGYFPMQEGLAWAYRVTTERRGRVETDEYAVRNLDSRSIGNRVELTRRTSDGTDYFLVEDRSGIYRTGKRLVVETGPTPDQTPRYVLRYPLKPGTEWIASTHAYVLRRLHPYEDSLRRGTRLDLSYQIVSLDETVDVPAGRFDNCLLVKGRGNMTIYSDAVLGFTEIPIETREWYAPNVGLVRLERIETLETQVFSGGVRRFELIRFDT